MDSTDEYAHSRLLYRGDQVINSIYEQTVKLMNGEDVNKNELLKEIDSIMHQNFKYRTAIISAKKDYDINEQTHSEAGTHGQKFKRSPSTKPKAKSNP